MKLLSIIVGAESAPARFDAAAIAPTSLVGASVEALGSVGCQLSAKTAAQPSD